MGSRLLGLEFLVPGFLDASGFRGLRSLRFWFSWFRDSGFKVSGFLCLGFWVKASEGAGFLGSGVLWV